MIAFTGLAYLWWGARQYAHKRASDQMLLVSQWWFLVTVWSSILLLHAGVQLALAFWLGYLTFRLVMAIGLRLRKLRDFPTDLQRNVAGSSSCRMFPSRTDLSPPPLARVHETADTITDYSQRRLVSDLDVRAANPHYR